MNLKEIKKAFLSGDLATIESFLELQRRKSTSSSLQEECELEEEWIAILHMILRHGKKKCVAMLKIWLAHFGSAHLQLHQQSINDKQQGGKTLLHIALENKHNDDDDDDDDDDGDDHYHVIEFLLQHIVAVINKDCCSANITTIINQRDDKGQSPLCQAVAMHDFRAVQLLVQYGADVNHSPNNHDDEKDDETPLMMACRKGYNDIALYLLSLTPQHVLNVNQKRNVGWTALHYACDTHNTSLVRALLQHGAHPNGGGTSSSSSSSSSTIISSSTFTTPLHLACRHSLTSSTGWRRLQNDGTSSLSSTTTDTTNTNQPRNIVFTATQSQHGSLQIMEMLLAYGACINAMDAHGKTPLHYACHDATSLPVVRFLLNHGANVFPNATTVAACKETPLHLACQTSKVATLNIVACLIQHARLQQLQQHQQSHLVTKLVNARDAYGRTPLHVACNASCPDVVEYLLQQTQANVHARVENPLSLHSAKGNSQELTVSNTMCNAGAMATDCSGSNGSNTSTTTDGWTPLHFACRRRNTTMVQVLLQHGARLDAVSARGETPLHVACQRWAWDVVRLLLSFESRKNDANGSDRAVIHEIVDSSVLHMADASGRTPLHLTVATGSQSAVRLLLRHGASLEVPDRYGQTPLWYAHCNLPLLYLLLREYNAIRQFIQLP